MARFRFWRWLTRKEEEPSAPTPVALNAEEIIELLKTNPNEAFDKLGCPSLSPELQADINREFAGQTYEEIRSAMAEAMARASEKEKTE